MKKIVITGGFAGLNLMKRLDSGRCGINLIGRSNYHCFSQLLYQVETAELEPSGDSCTVCAIASL